MALSAFQHRIEGIAQRIADAVAALDQQGQHHGRADQQARPRAQLRRAIGDEHAQ
jgi:hypothetical protein